jgi:peptide/nickel transport system substrate-binding protein
VHRRSLLLGAAAAIAAPLARPAIAGNAQTLSIVPQVALNSIDPVWTSSQIARNMGFMVFDLLYGRDEAMNPRPQMLEGDLMEDGGKRWTLKLRENLWFHDGEPVRSRDCIASLKRWMVRDAGGVTLSRRLDAIEASDDRTIVLRLNQPFPHLRTLLSKFIQPAMMMPERLANTDPFKQIPEAIGSGPFRWLADEHVLGSHAAFAKFDGYVPRDEPPSYTAGGHRVLVDRVEWKMIPDGQTAANALITGEVDWIEIPLPDLLPLLKRSAGVKVDVLDTFGQICFLRPNHIVAPTSNPGVRRAMLAALDQKEVMQAAMGGDPQNMWTDMGFLRTGKKEVDEAGMELVRNRPSRDQIKAMLDKAGYNNERIVLLHATDHWLFNPADAVIAHALSAAGFNIDDQAMDWATVQTRRPSREPLDKGGWSLFFSQVAAPEHRDPLVANFIRGNGKDGWFGWPTDPKIEALYAEWVATSDPAEQTRLERAYQLQSFVNLPFIPLGGYRQSAAWRDNVTGVLKGPSVVFWNVRKS